MGPVVMPIASSDAPDSDAFCFNKMDPDEAVVEATTGSAHRIPGESTYLEAPLRTVRSPENSSNFLQVTAARRFLIELHQEREKESGRKKTWTLTVIEALSGTPTLRVSFPPSISQWALEQQRLVAADPSPSHKRDPLWSRVEVAAPTAHSQFMALAASSHPRCGALSPARPLCAVPSLVGGSLWRDLVLATASRFALVFDVAPCSYLLVVGVSPLLLSVTHELRCGLMDPLRRMVSHRAGLSEIYKPKYTVMMYVDWQDTPLGRCIAPTGPWKGHTLAYFNESWLAVCNRDSRGDTTLSIWEIGEGTTTRGAFSDQVVIPIPGSYDNSGLLGWSDLCFNRMVPDEAMVLTSGLGGIAITLFDVRSTYRSKILATVVRTETAWRYGTGIKALAMRGRCGDVSFVVEAGGLVTLVESTSGRVHDITWECTELGQVSSSLFCVWSLITRAYSLWDCNNPGAPLRTVLCTAESPRFLQVTAGRGFLFTLQVEKGKGNGKIALIEALSGTAIAILNLSFPPSKFVTLDPRSSFLG
ncbi:hypothetical protein Pelo_8723 [Pelomyxa schiedti]|nr:hypothetical protein Pelo_8723 [Pelomyxa schiedti]